MCLLRLAEQNDLPAEAIDKTMNSATTPQPKRDRAIDALLAKRNATIIDRAVRYREGELDLITLEAKTLVFSKIVRIVSREAARTDLFPSTNQQRLGRTIARRWLLDEFVKHKDLSFNAIRFDVFVITVDEDGSAGGVEHFEDAF